jgi:predicted regulator of Ras-like GTPase activity (Roadblock/LC7/MglB family)
MLVKILENMLSTLNGARSAILLDGEGETVAEAGDNAADMRFRGAWKEIHLDHIREIAQRLRLGNVHAVLFSLDEGNELIIPVEGEYSLLIFLSPFTQVQEAMAKSKAAAELLQVEIR